MPFPVKQGGRQGGILSAPLYKLYIHPLLEKLEDSKLGLSLGGAHIGTPTCADDMVLMANNEWDRQAMIDITELFASQRRYTLHPTKSCVLHINQSGDDSLGQFHLCGEQMNTVDEVTHLGITRRSARRLTHLVEERSEKKFLFKVEENGKYNTSEFAITSTSHYVQHNIQYLQQIYK